MYKARIKLVIESEDLLMVYDGKSQYPSAMIDSDSYCHRVETGCIFTPDRESDLLNQFNNETFTQFKDQA